MSGCNCPPGSRCDCAGTAVATTSRPADGLSRLADRNYDVQAFTGYSASTVPAGQWYRGTLYRAAMPALILNPRARPVYDASDPSTWLPNP